MPEVQWVSWTRCRSSSRPLLHSVCGVAQAVLLDQDCVAGLPTTDSDARGNIIEGLAVRLMGGWVVEQDGSRRQQR